MLKHIKIVIILFIVTSCGNSKDNSGANVQEILVPELIVTDSLYFNQLKDILFSSSCFQIHKQTRHVFYLIYDKNMFPVTYENLLFVSMSEYCAYDKSELENDYGGFYIKKENDFFLFILKNTSEIPLNIYMKTCNKINISKYMGIIQESDVNWFLTEDNSKVELIYENCP